MNYPARYYALQLEAAFNRFSPPATISADAFEIRPIEAVEEGLTHLMLMGVLKKEDVPALMREYDFGNQSLRIYIKENGTDKIEDLISQVNAWADARLAKRI